MSERGHRSLDLFDPVPQFPAARREWRLPAAQKFDIETPGASTGYCMARNRPAASRSSMLIARTSAPSRGMVPTSRGDGVRTARLARAFGSHRGMCLCGFLTVRWPAGSGSVVPPPRGFSTLTIPSLNFQNEDHGLLSFSKV